MPFLLQDNQRLWIMQSGPYRCTVQVNDILTMELAAGSEQAHKKAKLVPDRAQDLKQQEHYFVWTPKANRVGYLTTNGTHLNSSLSFS